MVFVTLGTQDKPFDRLLKAIDKEIEKGTITGEVVVQAGCTKYESKNMKIFDLIPLDEFDELMGKCDYLITHGGVGSIVTGLNKDKKVIAVPRLEKYGEHINDHQLQIINNFDKMGYIIGCTDLDELEDKIKMVKKFKPNKYQSNRDKMVELVCELIDKE